MQLKADDSFDRRSVILMLGSVVLFAANTLMIRAVSLHTPAADGWVAIFFRSVIGLLVVWAIYGHGRGFDPKRLFSGKLITLRGVIGALSTIAFYITIMKLGAGRAVILNLTYPMFASAIAAIWLKEPVGRAAVAWMLIGFCGMVVFMGGDGNLSGISAYDLLALAGAVGSGWVVVIIRRLRHEENPATIYASQAFYGLVFSIPAAAKVTVLPTSAWLVLAAGAVIVTVAQLIMTRAYQFMSVSRGSSLQMLLPIATALGGFAFFGEVFGPREIVGALLTLLATWRVVVSRA